MSHWYAAVFLGTASLFCLRMGNVATAATEVHQNTQNPKDVHVTAEDQSRSVSDVELTRRIRQSLVSDNDLSVSSKNVTLVSRNGTVTLRGQVPTKSEKTRIENRAMEIAGKHAVVSQLTYQH